MSYCDFVKDLPPENLHRKYHDTKYGVPIKGDNELFGRLILEINQAGLSWNTILQKEQNFRDAYSNFDVEKVSAYGDVDRERLMQNAGIIRNKLKIDSAIYNAKRILMLSKEHGSFYGWLLLHKECSKKEWVTLFKKEFKFVGGEIVGEFLMSIDMLAGSHGKDCPRFKDRKI
jgi:DNA-3-methyladenine glycosylase I